MANIVRRNQEEREASRPRASELASWEPLQMMRNFLQWDPFREMQSFIPWQERGFVPDVELKETKNAYVFKADLPGIDEKNIEISTIGSRITITGRREQEETREDDRYYAYERNYGSFTRSFTLPEGADSENIKADLRNGELILTVPKRPEVQPKRIQVQGSSSAPALEEMKGQEQRKGQEPQKGQEQQKKAA